MTAKNTKIILASTSSIRKKMLEDLGVDFEAIKPLADEEAEKVKIAHLPLNEQAILLARVKAIDISKLHPNAYVLGSDQICECEGNRISKSKNENEAFISLKKLAGKTHFQNNGTCIFHNGELVAEKLEIVKLTMKNLSDEEIWNYIKLDNPIGCAGSYKFEENGHKLFEKIEGSHSRNTREAILGFSASWAVDWLKMNGVG